jgi:phosphoribosylamine--glycine ligase
MTLRILGIGESCDLGEMYVRLTAAGHEVRVFVEHVDAHDVFGGMLSRTDRWQRELPWIRQAGRQGVIVFESALKGDLQDNLRRDGFQVIGGSAYGDRLESEREFGQQALRDLGLKTARSHRFTETGSAIDFVRANPARYVLKYNGADSARTRNYVGEMDDGADIIALLGIRRDREAGNAPSDFVLMEHLRGVEVGVGAFFNGEHFLRPACLDWEHKRFFPGDLGELTGEMGTIVTYRGADTIFAATLARMADQLRAGGYCGYINLNLIANGEGLWPLEFTSRFGYPGYAICAALHLEGWDSIFLKMLGRTARTIDTRAGYAAGIVLTVPPFPYSHGYAQLSKGLPVCFRDSMTSSQRDRLHLCEVASVQQQLVTSGTTGCIGVATGAGDSIEAARQDALALAGQVVVPNLRYRKDIGQRLIESDFSTLTTLGYLPASLRP